MRNNILVKSHYYCPVCYISLDYHDDGALDNCPSCDKHFSYKELRVGGHYFVQIPLKQLKDLLSGPLFSQLQRSTAESGVLCDISSRNAYQKLSKIMNNYDITIQWNADGVSIFQSSKISMCPIQVAINELPYRVRKENILLTGLWCSAEKPIMNLYLKPFVDELNELSEHDIECLHLDSTRLLRLEYILLLSSLIQ